MESFSDFCIWLDLKRFYIQRGRGIVPGGNCPGDVSVIYFNSSICVLNSVSHIYWEVGLLTRLYNIHEDLTVCNHRCAMIILVTSFILTFCITVKSEFVFAGFRGAKTIGARLVATPIFWPVAAQKIKTGKNIISWIFGDRSIDSLLVFHAKL